jgi:hypothetical protein
VEAFNWCGREDDRLQLMRKSLGGHRMPFPLSVPLKGSVPTVLADLATLDGPLAALLTALRYEGAEEIEVDGTMVRFRLNRTRAPARSNWHPLSYASSGTVRLEHSAGCLRLRGELRLWPLMWLPLLAIPMMLFFGFPWVGGVAAAAAVWGGGMLISWVGADGWADDLLHQIEPSRSDTRPSVAT